MAGRKRRKGPTFSIVEEFLERQKEKQAKNKKQDIVAKNKKIKKQVKIKEKKYNTDKILEEMQQEKINFKDNIKQIAKIKSEVDKKTEWHYKMKESVENDDKRKYEYAHIVSAILSKTIEER